MEIQLSILRRSRASFAALLDEIPYEKLTAIPPGFNNNLLWNIGHVLVSQQLLCYGMSGVPMRVPDSYKDMFRKSTSPAGWSGEVNREELKSLLLSTPDILEKDWREGHFQTYKPYTTSMGLTLSNFAQAFTFINFHDGIHLGVAMSLKKIV